MKTKFYTLTFLFFVTVNANAQWQPTNGPYGGMVNCLIVKSADIFAGTYHGIYVSHNNGTSWAVLNADLQDKVVTALAFNDTNIFAAAYSGTFGNYKYEVLRSSDTGASWVSIDNILPKAPVSAMAVSNDKIIVAINGGNGVHFSGDNGDNWSRVSNLDIYTLAFSGSDVYAGGAGGVYRSINNGMNWIHTNFPGTTVLKVGINGTTIFAADNGDFWLPSHIYQSSDSGATWTNADGGLFNPSVTAFAFSGSNCFFSGSGAVHISTNGGVNWSPVSNGLGKAPFDVIISGTNLFAATAEGVYSSDNNGTKWTSQNQGLEKVVISALEVNGTTIYAGSQYGRVFISSDSGLTWTLADSSLEYKIRTVYRDGNNLYAGTLDGGVFKSKDNGQSWKHITTGITSQTISSFGRSGNNLITATLGGIFLSVDDGEHWTLSGLGNQYFHSMVINGGVVFAGTIFDGVYVSKDSGMNWSITNLPGCDALAFCGNTIFCAAHLNPVCYSSDTGVTNSIVHLQIPYPEVYTFAVESVKMFAGTNDGVFYSSDAGMHWEKINDGLGDPYAMSLKIGSSEIYAATNNGIWKRSLNNIITSVPENISEAVFNIYPNPASDVFTVTANQQINSVIEIYNILGEKVYSETLTGKQKTINCKLNSGMYFIKMSDKKKELNQKLIIL